MTAPIRVALLLVVASLGLLPATMSAQQPPSASGDSVGVQSAGYRLAMLTNPLDCFDVGPGSAAARELTRMLAADPGNLEIEAGTPGYIAYATAVVLEQTQAIRGRLAEDTWAALAPIFDAGLTPAQLSQASVFFTSEAGRRLVRDVCANMDMQIIGESMSDANDYQVSADAIDRSQRQAAEGSAARLADYSARDRAAVQWFSQTDASRAMARLRPTVLATVAEVGNRPDPAFEAAIEREITRFFERAAKGGKPSPTP